MIIYDYYAGEAADFSKLRDTEEDTVTEEDVQRAIGQIQAIGSCTNVFVVYLLAKQTKLEKRIRELESKHNE